MGPPKRGMHALQLRPKGYSGSSFRRLKNPRYCVDVGLVTLSFLFRAYKEWPWEEDGQKQYEGSLRKVSRTVEKKTL